jgi:fatty acid desaturase
LSRIHNICLVRDLKCGNMCATAAISLLPRAFAIRDRGRMTTNHPNGGTVELPTVALVVAWWAAAIGVVAGHAALPWFVSVPVLALLGALHGSLQHEAIHGHPTPWQRVNTALVWVPATLWCPFPEYRASHLAHHANELTVPGLDPESFYVDVDSWEAAGPLTRLVMRINRTLLGRMVIGPPVMIGAALRRAALDAWREPGGRARMWAAHALGAAVLWWLVVGVAGLPWWEYLLGAVWGGTSLTLLRSFAEHRAPTAGGSASAVVRSRWLGLLYLHNNLHHTHHALPGAPWYALPQLHADLGSDEIARAGAGLYDGYGDVARRYLVRPFDTPVHPGGRVVADAR